MKLSKLNFQKKKKRKNLKNIEYKKLFIVLIVILLIFLFSKTIKSSNPNVTVWPAYENIKIPTDLKKFLLTKDTCNSKSKNKNAMNLWGVNAVTNNSYAKLSYGCASTLTNYMVALKYENKWKLIEPSEYFFSPEKGIPKCSVVYHYKIPKTFEPFCVNDLGSIISSTNS